MECNVSNNMTTPTVCNISVKHLRQRNIQNFTEWDDMPNTLYIGRNMNRYVKGTYGSKWSNPFNVNKYGREKCLKLYKKYILEGKLYDCLDELDGVELGCWCSPEKCHGDILVELFNQKFDSDSGEWFSGDSQ